VKNNSHFSFEKQIFADRFLYKNKGHGLKVQQRIHDLQDRIEEAEQRLA